jgi:putative membrane protein
MPMWFNETMGMWGGWPFMWLGPLVLLALAIAAVFWLVRATTGPDRRPGDAELPRRRGLAVLEERYARGEISREEFLQKKADLEG